MGTEVDDSSGKQLFKTSYSVDSQIVAFYTGGKIQLSADGKYLFATCDGTVKIVSIETGKTIATVGEGADAVVNFVLSPDDKVLVTALTSSLFKQWDWQAAKETPTTVKVEDDETVGDGDRCKRIKTWKGTHKGPISSMAMDVTSTLLATGGVDSTIKVWDINRQYITHNLKGVRGVVRMLQYLPSTEKFVIFATGDDHHIRAWDLQTSDCIAVLEGHLTTVTCLAFTKDGSTMLSSGRDQVVIFWDIENHFNMITIRTIPVFEVVESVILVQPNDILPAIGIEDFSHLNFITAGNKGLLRVWASSGKLLFTQKMATVAKTKTAAEGDELVIVHAFFSAATNMVVVITFEHNIIFYRLDNFALEKQLVGYNDDILDVTYLGEGDTHFAVATNSIHIKVFEITSFDCKLLRGHTDIVLALDSFQSNPLMMVSSSKDNSIRIWLMNADTKDVFCVATGQGHTHHVGTVACSRLNAKFLMSGSHDTCIKLWNVPMNLADEVPTASSAAVALSVKWTLVAHEKDVNSMCVSPNDRLLATGSQDKLGKIWNAKDGTLVATLRGHRRGIWCVQFSPVDQVLASSSADGVIKIWSISDFSCVKTFEGHECSVLKVIFIGRGMQLLSCASDGLLKLWTIKSNECIKTLDGHDSRIWALRANRAESAFISGGSDSKIVIWKDTTEVEKAAERQKLEEAIEQEQELQNLLQQKRFNKALSYCVLLEQPGRALKVISEILLQTDGKDQLEKTVQNFRPDQIDVLLKFAVSWNMNSRKCYEAQHIVNIVLRSYSTEELLKLPNIQSIVQGLLPYTERHYERYGRLMQQSAFIEYTWQKMKMNENIEFEKR